MAADITGLYKQVAQTGSGHPIHKLYGDTGNEGARNRPVAPSQPNLKSNPTYDAGVHSYTLPYPGQAHDGSAKDLANTHAIVSQEEKANSVQYAIDNQPTWLDKLALMTNVGAVTAGVGSVIGPAVAGAVSGGAAAGTGAATAGAIAGGAATGAAGGLVQSALTGSNVGKNVLTGAVLGGIGGGLKPVVSNATGLTGTTGNIVNSGITKGVTGAIGGALSGQGAGSGATAGAISGVGGAVGGSIFNSPGSTVDPQLTQSSNPSTPPVSADYSSFDSSYFDPSNQTTIPMDTGYGSYSPSTDPGSSGYTNYGNTPGYTPSTPNNAFDPNFFTGGGGSTGFNPQGGGSGGGGAGTTAGSSIAGFLSKLFGGGGGNGSGGGLPPGLLQQLLGFGASTAGNVLNSNAAKGAASTYAGETKFNPYTVTGNNGTTSFNGTTATQTLSPQAKALQDMLSKLSGNSGAALAAGPKAAIDSNFNALQSADLQAQQRLLGNTQDNEFSHGVLGSTAGGYQTQGALQAIGAQTGQNYSHAVDQANTQQQQQLADLTAGLNGNQAITADQMEQLRLALSGGEAAGNTNLRAYMPSLYTNSNSTFGNALTGFGNSISNGSKP